MAATDVLASASASAAWIHVQTRRKGRRKQRNLSSF
jgi:hypothetical protein